MAGVLISNLYPPILETYLPTFIVREGGTIQVPFSFSKFNSRKDVSSIVQVSITRQDSNISALADKYKTKTYFTKIEGKTEEYYITIPQNVFKNGKPESETYYKLQMRFISSDGDGIESLKEDVDAYNDTITSSMINKNYNKFSEWSSVGILYGIDNPKIVLDGITLDEASKETTTTLNVTDISGRLTFESSNPNRENKEYLRYYIIELYENDILKFKSKTQRASKSEEYRIYYTLPYNMISGQYYKIRIHYTTSNLYTSYQDFEFQYVANILDSLNVLITPYNTDKEIFNCTGKENARIRLEIESLDDKNFIGSVAIRRSSHRNNFQLWEDIAIINYPTVGKLNFTYYDYTVESGVLYKYCIQRYNSFGDRGVISTHMLPIMTEFESIYLYGRDDDKYKQLNIRFNPQVTNFKHNISESKIDTIGGKYPIIRRNGNMDYRSFNISGTIAHQMDEDNLFTSRSIIYGDWLENYDEYNADNSITEVNDYIYEKEFREKVIEFLYDKNPKLFKSTTEGNMIVKVMNVSLTPNNTLSRFIYDFSAEIVEIAEYSMENLKALGLLDKGTYVPIEDVLLDKFGIINVKDSNYNIQTSISNKYNIHEDIGVSYTFQYIKWLQITMDSAPYLIYERPSGGYSTEGETPVASGYLIEINNNQFILNPNGFFSIGINDNIEVTTLSVIGDATISYVAVLKQHYEEPAHPSKINIYDKIGHIEGVYAPNTNLMKIISNRHYYSAESNASIYEGSVHSLTSLTIESEPGTVFLIQDTLDDKMYSHTVNPTGILNLHYDDINFSNIQVKGIAFVPNVETKGVGEKVNVIDPMLKAHTYIEQNKATKVEPIVGYVYNSTMLADRTDIDKTYDNLITAREWIKKRYIYFDGKFRPFTDEDIMIYPIDLTIDYTYQYVTKEYEKENISTTTE